MKKNTKITLIVLSSFLLSNAALAASGNKDMKVSAIVKTGCTVSATPYNFGDIFETKRTESFSDMSLQCSKGTQVRISGSDKNNPGFFNGPRMWRVGVSSDLPNNRIGYGVLTNLTVTTPDLEVIRHPLSYYLWDVGANDYSMLVKTTTGNRVVLKFRALVTAERGTSGSSETPFNQKTLIPGNYTDDFTYNLIF